METKRKPGRPRKHASDADRLKAWRANLKPQLDAYETAFKAWRSALRDIHVSEFDQAQAMVETYLQSADHPAASLFIEALHRELYWAKDEYCRKRRDESWDSRPIPPEHLIKYLDPKYTRIRCYWI